MWLRRMPMADTDPDKVWAFVNAMKDGNADAQAAAHRKPITKYRTHQDLSHCITQKPP